MAEVRARVVPAPSGISSEELVASLERAGATRVAHQTHGDLLAMHRRLLFIPSTSNVALSDLADTLRTARLTRAAFDELLYETRLTQPAPRQRAAL
jgi:hypothetical protein